jgi:excisionase family DNA binding protein
LDTYYGAYPSGRPGDEAESADEDQEKSHMTEAPATLSNNRDGSLVTSPASARRRLIKVYPDLAEALSISRSKAFELCASGEVKTVRFGRAVRVPVEEVDRVIQERLAESAA